MSRHAFVTAVESQDVAIHAGFVRKVSPGRVEASGPMAGVGDICEIECGQKDGATVLAEVAAVAADHIVLVPLDQSQPIPPDARVVARRAKARAPVGDAFAGRAIDAFAAPIDGGAAILPETLAPLAGDVLQPLERREADRILETGIRALDGLLTLGIGQRVGVFAASGVGKTTLVRQLAAQITCDHCVLCLVGERGREVEQAWAAIAGSPERKKYTCVAATSDMSPPLRARAVYQALCLAEHWRAKGRHVLLILDSVTRFAMALREIGLASGAPPTLRAYTPNVFASLPRLIERCGGAKAGGAITAILTVLSETDDVDDPIVEVMKALLDGHIILSRPLAEQGRFPPIDVIRSVSRKADRLVTPPQANAARRAVALLAAYEEARLMIESGVHKTGVNPRVDDAIRARDTLQSFLTQRSNERAPLVDTLQRLHAAIGASDYA